MKTTSKHNFVERNLRRLRSNRYWIETAALRMFGVHYETAKNVMFGKKNQFSELHLFADYLRRQTPRGTMVDVGAQYGESFAPFAAFGWKILAFEPDPNAAKLTAITGRSTKNVSLFKLAISNKEGEVPFYASPVSTGVSTLNPFLDTHEQVTMVKTTTLANALREQSIGKVDFLKIDTEGHDLFVLEGVDWEVSRPTAVLCEFDEKKTLQLGYSFSDMASLLVEKGYEVFVSEWYPIEQYGVDQRWRSFKKYECSLASPDGWGNLVAISADSSVSFHDYLARRRIAFE